MPPCQCTHDKCRLKSCFVRTKAVTGRRRIALKGAASKDTSVGGAPLGTFQQGSVTPRLSTARHSRPPDAASSVFVVLTPRRDRRRPRGTRAWGGVDEPLGESRTQLVGLSCEEPPVLLGSKGRPWHTPCLISRHKGILSEIYEETYKYTFSNVPPVLFIGPVSSILNIIVLETASAGLTSQLATPGLRGAATEGRSGALPRKDEESCCWSSVLWDN